MPFAAHRCARAQNYVLRNFCKSSTPGRRAGLNVQGLSAATKKNILAFLAPFGKQ